MPGRTLKRKTAREMAAARKTHRGGRPAKPSLCKRCGAACPSVGHALVHCRPGSYPPIEDPPARENSASYNLPEDEA